MLLAGGELLVLLAAAVLLAGGVLLVSWCDLFCGMLLVVLVHRELLVVLLSTVSCW